MITDSQATANDLERVFGVKRSGLRPVHLGIEERFSPVARAESGAVRLALGLPERYFVHVGSVHPRKNLVNLLRAYKLALADNPSLPALVLAGKDGYRAAEIHQEAQKLGLDQQVRFLGYTPDERLPALIAGAVGLVMVSWYEGFGLPALEAMACGAPVLASNTTSLPEIVGDAGLLVPPGDILAISEGLLRLAGEPALRDELAGKGLQRAAQFSWRRCAEETLKALEEAAG